jgi:tetratricopeptide (TPR) repeat protein
MKPKIKFYIWILTIATIFSAISFFILSDIPFGFLFKLSFYFSFIGLILLSFIFGFQLFKRKRFWKKSIGIVAVLFSIVLFILFAILLIDFRILLNGEIPHKLTKEEWIEDLDFLTNNMETIHPDLFSLASENEYRTAVKNLRNNIPHYDENSIKAEFLKILALSNDAHSIPHIQSFNLDWHMYPINIFYFNDGIYITDAGRRNKHLIGSKILKIGNTQVEEVYERMKKYLATENEYHSMNRVAIILISEWLLAEKIIDDTQNVAFTLQTINGEEKVVRLNPIHYLPYFYWSLINRVDNNISPVLTNDKKDNYWFEFREESKTFYFQFNSVEPIPNKPWNAFLAEMEDSIIKLPVDRFIMDLRNNSGGHVGMLHPLANLIIENKKINQKGKLFVLISRKTFSAAVLLSSMLEKNSKVIFAGEPTSQAPNQKGAGAPQLIELPNSKLEYHISTKFFHASIDVDKRDMISPDIFVEYTIEDFMTNKDVIFDKILVHKIEPITQLEINQEVIDRIVGRYLFSPHQILHVQKENNTLNYTISDYMETSLQNISSELYAISDNLFQTNVDHIKISFVPNENSRADSLLFIWGAETKRIPRVADDFHLPMELFSAYSIDKAIEEALKNKEFFTQHSANMENHFNLLGYKYIGEKNYDDAMKILAFNIELFPESANAYDSYAEACMLSGNKDVAIKNYKKSLELNPNNKNAERMLKKL